MSYSPAMVLQHGKCLNALDTCDKDLAGEVLLIEERVSSCEQFAEAHGKQYMAGGDASASGVRAALFALKTARQLAGIGGQGKKIGEEIIQTNKMTGGTFATNSSLAGSFKASNKILELACTAFVESDASLLSLVFARIDIARELVADTKLLLQERISNRQGSVYEMLHLFSIAEGLSQTIELSKTAAVLVERFSQTSAVAQ